MVQYKSKLLKSGRNRGKYRYTRTLYAPTAAGVPEKPARVPRKKRVKKAKPKAKAVAFKTPPRKKTGKKRRLGSKQTTVLV